MGHAFTRRLCACGYPVTGYDIAAEKLEAAARHGVRPAASAAEVTRASDIVQICVMTAGDLERRFRRPGRSPRRRAPARS